MSFGRGARANEPNFAAKHHAYIPSDPHGARLEQCTYVGYLVSHSCQILIALARKAVTACEEQSKIHLVAMTKAWCWYN